MHAIFRIKIGSVQKTSTRKSFCVLPIPLVIRSEVHFVKKHKCNCYNDISAKSLGTVTRLPVSMNSE
jgi:hypothetical protein